MTKEKEWELLEEYLGSRDERYYVPDCVPENAVAVIFQPWPTKFDLDAKAPASALKTWHGCDLFGKDADFDTSRIGTAYISNVPLYGTDEETFKLAGPLEGVRLAPRPASEILRAQFGQKMRRIVESESVRLVAYKLEIFMRYYEDFAESAEPELSARLRARLSDGSLRILPFPNYGIDQIRAYEKQYNDFKSVFDEVVS